MPEKGSGNFHKRMAVNHMNKISYITYSILVGSKKNLKPRNSS